MVYFYTIMDFEFGKRKSEANKKKHGIDEFRHREKITNCLDLSCSRRPGQEQKRVNVYFTEWIIVSLAQPHTLMNINMIK